MTTSTYFVPSPVGTTLLELFDSVLTTTLLTVLFFSHFIYLHLSDPRQCEGKKGPLQHHSRGLIGTLNSRKALWRPWGIVSALALLCTDYVETRPVGHVECSVEAAGHQKSGEVTKTKAPKSRARPGFSPHSGILSDSGKFLTP